MKKLNKVLCVLFALVMCCSFAVTAFAAEPVSVRLEADVRLSGDVPQNPEEFVLVLTNVKTEQESRCTVKGDGTGVFDRLTFDNVGVYKYTVRQQKGSNPDCTYDDTVYYLTVTVFNSNKEFDFNVAATVYKDGADEKQDAIVFENIYKTKTAEEPTTEEPTTETPTTEPTQKTEPSTTEPYGPTEKTTAEDKPSPHDNPNTGDNSRMPMWMVMFAVGFVFVSGSLVALIPKKKDSDE